jgi:hypothetical protein
MSSAPTDLQRVREWINNRTNIGYAALGIVGDTAHDGGYHCGSDRVVNGDYSVVESSRDAAGLTISASALDVGIFRYNAVTLRTFSIALVGMCATGDPRCKDVREIIYSPDGVKVLRWDRLGIRSSGDSSHTFHTHISFFRDSEGRRDSTNNFLGVVQQIFGGGTTMQWTDLDHYGAGPDGGTRSYAAMFRDTYYTVAGFSTTFAKINAALEQVKAEVTNLNAKLAEAKEEIAALRDVRPNSPSAADIASELIGQLRNE